MVIALAVLAGLIAGLWFGFVVGCMLTRKRIDENCAGTLREDRSDPSEGPYLFLELEPGGLDIIHKSNTVCFKVKMENYLPRN